ncbi:Oxoglutarate/iron-dependent dioxygenase [Corchorus olitorius]|uniref:Oxoglutarate/iron-dependent dioxygenase n=1 Tax=Corchorus olitorius TaxID=93759 RepID=A0A1R3JZB2_9ROSI|nr:Oxoglutarate/iron-dependent dioxygenase [Corchorus olitorius]
MGTETPLKVPVIDFSNPELKPGTAEWDSVKGQVRRALQDYNCFEASFDKIPAELRGSLFRALQELFDLPLEAKIRNVSEIPYHGYFGHPLVPLFESLGFEDANIIEKVEDQTRALWPQGNSSFSKTIQTFTKQLSELDQMVRRMILESFNLEKYMDEHMDSTNYVFRTMKYNAPKTNEPKVGLGSHKDKDIITILHQMSEVDGLAVQNKDGEWIDVNFSKNSFLVIIGESLHAWLNGRLNATYHRVMMTGDKERYAVGLFSVPKAGYMIKAPEELVDEAHPLLYKPYDYVELLNFTYTEAGQVADTSALKVFCGV